MAEDRRSAGHLHHYFGIDKDIVWDIVATKVPELLVQLKQVSFGQDEGQERSIP